MISRSRFNNVKKYTVQRADGVFITVYSRRLPITSTVNTVLASTPSTRIDLVAYDAYGDVRLYWALNDVSSLVDPFDMFKNPPTKIIIPSVTDINQVVR